jgi:pilus assembly protein TadC
MIAAGAMCTLLAVVALSSAARRDSAVQRRLTLFAPVLRRAPRWRAVSDRDLRQAGLLGSHTLVIAAKGLGAIVGAMAGAALGVLPVALACAYGGWVAPSLVIERRARARRRAAERACGAFLERIEALAAAGRPIETAMIAIARLPTSSIVLDAALQRAADAYALGAPLFAGLAAAAQEEGIAPLAALAAALDRARGLGQGSLAVVRNARDAARAAERAGSVEAAATVEGKLMLTLVLCYLPALMLLVVIPLFLTLLDGLFG